MLNLSASRRVVSLIAMFGTATAMATAGLPEGSGEKSSVTVQVRKSLYGTDPNTNYNQNADCTEFNATVGSPPGPATPNFLCPSNPGALCVRCSDPETGYSTNPFGGVPLQLANTYNCEGSRTEGFCGPVSCNVENFPSGDCDNGQVSDYVKQSVTPGP